MAKRTAATVGLRVLAERIHRVTLRFRSPGSPPPAWCAVLNGQPNGDHKLLTIRAWMSPFDDDPDGQPQPGFSVGFGWEWFGGDPCAELYVRAEYSKPSEAVGADELSDEADVAGMYAAAVSACAKWESRRSLLPSIKSLDRSFSALHAKRSARACNDNEVRVMVSLAGLERLLD